MIVFCLDLYFKCIGTLWQFVDFDCFFEVFGFCDVKLAFGVHVDVYLCDRVVFGDFDLD